MKNSPERSFRKKPNSFREIFRKCQKQKHGNQKPYSEMSCGMFLQLRDTGYEKYG